jgi:hypothetical protein
MMEWVPELFARSSPYRGKLAQDCEVCAAKSAHRRRRFRVLGAAALAGLCLVAIAGGFVSLTIRLARAESELASRATASQIRLMLLERPEPSPDREPPPPSEQDAFEARIRSACADRDNSLTLRMLAAQTVQEFAETPSLTEGLPGLRRATSARERALFEMKLFESLHAVFTGQTSKVSISPAARLRADEHRALSDSVARNVQRLGCGGNIEEVWLRWRDQSEASILEALGHASAIEARASVHLGCPRDQVTSELLEDSLGAVAHGCGKSMFYVRRDGEYWLPQEPKSPPGEHE